MLAAQEPQLFVSMAEPRRGSGEGAGHVPTEGTRERSVRQKLYLPVGLQSTQTYAPTPRPAGRDSWGQGPSSCSLLLPPAQCPAVHTPSSTLQAPPGHSSHHLILLQLRGPALVCRAGRTESGNMRRGVGMWPQDVAIALPCPTQNRSAIPHVSPEARARTFMCTHTQPSQLFPKKGSSLQENSSNQLSRKWREVGGGGNNLQEGQSSGSSWSRAVHCWNILLPGSRQALGILAQTAPFFCWPSLPPDPKRPEGPPPASNPGQAAPWATSHLAGLTGKALVPRRLLPRKNGLVGPFSSLLSRQHSQGTSQGPQAATREALGRGSVSGRL